MRQPSVPGRDLAGTLRILRILLLIVVMTFLVAVVYEFWLEEPLCALLGIPYNATFEMAERWQFIFTSTAFAAIALIGPGILLARDRAELRSTLAALELARRDAAAANRAKIEFLASMSRDLGAPLNAVVGLAELLAENDGGERRCLAEGIRRSGTRLAIIITDIVEMAMIEAGRLALAPRPLDPAALTHDVVTALRPSLARKRLGLQLDVPERLPLIEADPARLGQVLRSLLSNAVKFTPEDGIITVRAASRPRGGVAIEIADTGVGIAPEALPLVLLPFTQLAAGCPHEPRGAGLGLPLAKALVELHGGALTIRSRLGGGTRVEVGLPARAPSYDPAI